MSAMAATAAADRVRRGARMPRRRRSPSGCPTSWPTLRRTRSSRRSPSPTATTCCCASTDTCTTRAREPSRCGARARVDSEFTNVVQRVYRSDGSFFDDSSRDPHMIFEPRGRSRSLAPEGRGAVLAVERGQDGRGGARDEDRLLPDRQPAARDPRAQLRGLRPRPIQQLLRPGASPTGRACSRASPPAGATSIRAHSPSNGWT